MNITAQVKLLPDARQVELLTRTMVLFNDACNYVSKIAFQRKVYQAISLHNLKMGNNISLYYHLRAKYRQLVSMHIELVLRKVADAYRTQLVKLKKGKKPKQPCKFKDMSGIPYNHHICNYQSLVRFIGDKLAVPTLSLSALTDSSYGRIKVDYVISDHQRKIFMNTIPLHYGCEARLLFRKGVFYLNIPIEQCLSEPIEVKDSIGVDLGISNIATTSYGKIWSGAVIDNKREKFQKHRSSLQKCGTPSAKRRLKKVAGKEAKFRKDVNHCISKELVAVAKGTASRIVLEDLTHIRTQTTVRKQQRARHHSWSFAQLREFITYKALMEGIEVKLVDPHYTSQRCSNFGSISGLNRKSQFRFSCMLCGHDAHADYNAACNLAWLGDNDVSSFSKAESTIH